MLRVSGWLIAAFTVLTLLVVAGLTAPIDNTWNTAMVNGEVPVLVAIARTFGSLGNPRVAVPTVVVGALTLTFMGRVKVAGWWVAMIVVAQVAASITKVVVGRERPVDALIHQSSAAYPSGHATVSGMAMAVGLAVLMAAVWPKRARFMGGVALMYAVSMAWSRTYLRVHWLTDVVGGLLLGLAVVVAVGAVAAWWERRSAPHPTHPAR